MLYIGVDLGGTNIAAGLVDEEGKILHKCSRPTGVERGAEAVIGDIAGLCQQVMDETGHTAADIKAIGVGVPGICHPDNGVVEFCTNLFWHKVPLRQIMNRTLDIPVFIGNDATVAGLAESVAGVSRGSANSVFITLGTGVGGGIVEHGQVLGGARGIAGELGHFTLYQDGAPCPCGKRGCFESYASTSALVRAAQARFGDPTLDGRAIFARAEAGDGGMLSLLERWIGDISAGISGLVHILGPELVLIGGGVSAQEKLLIEPLRRKVLGQVMPRFAEGLRIERAELGNDAGLVGAACFLIGRYPELARG